MKASTILKMKNNGIVAVVRGNTEQEGYEYSKKIIEGGIKTIELTFSTPFADNVIEKLSKEYSDDDEVLIGAGTVLDDITARIAILKGAKFVVSPHFDKKISIICNRYMVPYLPGCGTVTEVVNALESGCDVVKLFPGSLLKPSFIKDIKGPLPFVNAMPSGGVSIENMHEWIEAGAFTVGIGSALTKNAKKDIESIKEESKKFVEKYKSLVK